MKTCLALVSLLLFVQEKAEYPAQVLDLSIWKLQLPEDTEHPGQPDEIQVAELKAWSHPQYFHLNEAGDGVVFQAPCGGVSTKNSQYPRSELREMDATGEKLASWSTADRTVHELSLTLAIKQTPPVKKHVVCAQIHDGESDLLQIRLEGKKLFVERDGGDEVMLNKDYQLGTKFDLKITAGYGVVEVWYNHERKMEWKIESPECYFKAGCYTQSNVKRGDKPDSVGEVILYQIARTRR